MKKSMKRLIAIICVAVMLVGIIPAANLGQVNATELTEEKTVDVQRLEEGHVTPNQDEWNSEYTKDGYVFGGYYTYYDETNGFSNPLTEAREATEDAPVYIRWVPKEVMNVKAQVREDEYEGYKRVISNCDSKGTEDSNLASESQGTIDKENKKEGDASLYYTRSAATGINSSALMNFYLTVPKDVTGYKYFSCKIKIEGELVANSSGDCLHIRLTSGGTAGDQYALQFQLTPDELEQFKTEDGWYDLKLPFAQAESIVSTGDYLYDGSAIEFIQFRRTTATGAITLWVDDICALNEDPGFVIADCDQEESYTSMINQSKSNSIIKEDSTTEVEEVKEGNGAIKGTCYTSGTSYRMMAQFAMNDANKLDISTYKTTGILHLWLYIADYENLNGKFTIQLSSSYGTDAGTDANCVRYDIVKDELQPGWNEILQPLKDYYIPTNRAEVDWSALNYVRVVTTAAVKEADQAENAYMIVDDIRIIDTVQITDCDTTDEIDTDKAYVGIDSISTEDVKQGTGAFVQTESAIGTVHRLPFKQAIDFSAFKGNNGSLHFWFYIENTVAWTNKEGKSLLVGLSSNGTYTATNAQDYYISSEYITTGWNEIYINLDDTGSDTSGATDVDWTAINCITIACGSKKTDMFKTMIDDISLVAGNKNTADVRFVSTVESLEYKSVGYEISQSFSPDKPLTADTRDVYETLYELGTDGELDSVTPSGISGLNCSKRMYTATIVNLPNRLWDAVFTVTPYWVTQDGTKVTGEARELSINYAFNVSRQETTPMDVYLIAGQSNAAGFTPLAYDADNDGTNEWDATTGEGWVGTSRVNGFSNVLYSGTSNTNSVAVALTKADVHGNGNMGPEVGMADALSSYYNEESGKVAGIIKYAYGGTGLLDLDHTDTACTTVGNWVSPSYEAVLIQRNGAVKHGELTGKLYENLLAQVEESLEYYRKAGYEPTIKGLYWMQGEHDRGDIYDNRESNDSNYDYTEAFTYFANDIREDLANLTGDSNLKAMPIIVGTISETFSNADTLVTYNKYFIEIQKALASAEENIYVVDNSQYAMNELVDGESTYVQYCTDGKHWGYDKHLEIGQNVGNEFWDIYGLGE